MSKQETPKEVRKWFLSQVGHLSGSVASIERKGYALFCWITPEVAMLKLWWQPSPIRGRLLPRSLYIFSYPLTESAILSQNYPEHIFLLDIETALPSQLIGIWIADRGYACALLLLQNEQEGHLDIIRGRDNTIITYNGRRMKLKKLPAPSGHVTRYNDVLYHAERQVCLDVAVIITRKH